MNRRNWIRETERNTRRRTPPGEAVGRKVYIEELSRAEQISLVRELVDTRGAELCRAYRNVIDVAFGYKSRRSKKTNQRRLVRIPCVIFIVKRKWAKVSEVNKEEKLPTHLFAYWPVRGERKLCAVPTDVDDASTHAGFKPQVLGDEILVKAHGKTTFGSVTCAVHRSLFGNQPFAISCRHIFSLSKVLHPQEVLGASVGLAGSGRSVGESVDVKGPLADDIEFSHDAQIAIVKDTEALREALGDINVFDFAHSEEHVPDELVVMAPGKRIRANLRGFVRRSIDYGRPGATNVIHERLILCEVSMATQPGQSGSPLMSRDGRGLLVGMHVAGKVDGSESLALALPAWHLFDPVRYGLPPGAERWIPFNP